MSKWLVGIKRLIQEVERVEQPMSPSSVCFPASDGTPFKSLATQPTDPVEIQSTVADQTASEPAFLVADDKSESPAESESPELLMPNATQLPAELHETNRLPGEQVELAEANEAECEDTDSVRSSLEGSNLGSVVKPAENLSNDTILSEAAVG